MRALAVSAGLAEIRLNLVLVHELDLPQVCLGKRELVVGTDDLQSKLKDMSILRRIK